MTKRSKREDTKRKLGKREPEKRILIVCEGEKTEPNYFKAFREDMRNPAVMLKIVGIGFNTSSLIKRIVDFKKQAIKEKEPYDLIWAVFDRDSFVKGDIEDAFNLARENGIRVAFSNEAFEVWYLLHYDYVDSALSRAQYADMLSKRMGKPYLKNASNVYWELKDKQGVAIRNAKKLIGCYGMSSPCDNNPSTTVHELVELLNKCKKN